MKVILGVLVLMVVFGYLAVGLDRMPPEPNLIADVNAAIAEASDLLENGLLPVAGLNNLRP